MQHDVLIVGAGLAGMRAAYEAHSQGADVALITKVYPVRSHSNAAQGGINAALTDRGDAWEEHAFETVKGSDYLGDQDSISILSQDAGPRFALGCGRSLAGLSPPVGGPAPILWPGVPE